MKTVSQKAALVAIQIANDDSHGYDNRECHRLGNPDFACSSFVAYCYRQAGIEVPLNSYTATMKKTWKEYGFCDVAETVNLKNGANLKIGDVLIAPGKHTAIVVSNTHRLAEACGNPKGSAQNGATGDQTGNEIRIRRYYDDGWSQCLRLKRKWEK